MSFNSSQPLLIAALGPVSDVRRMFSGRIHSAVVSGVNSDAKTVTVEWFERGETKGKEVRCRRVPTSPDPDFRDRPHDPSLTFLSPPPPPVH